MPAALPRRQTLRLRNYDYPQPGAYYVTLCTQRRACLFGRVVDGQMHTNDFGDIIIQDNPARWTLDEYYAAD